MADLQASFEAFNVYTAKVGANTDYNFKYDVQNNGMVVDDAVLSVPENGKSIEALKEGIAYVKVTESESLNKTSFAKIVVLPQDADYDFQPKVQAGTNHTITVRYDGSVWGFGVNTHGQLGTGNTDTSDKPVAAFTTSKIYVDADAGYDHTLLLDKNGVVWAAGNNDRGQLGITTADGESHIFTRVNVDLGVGEKFVSIAAGNGFSMALTNKGNVYAWGDNTHGQLGLGDETEVATPKKLAIANVRQISVGEDHTLFLQMNGTVYATGNYKHNKLGIYNLSGDLRIPTKVPSFLGASVVAVSAGTNHSLALYYTTNAASFGDNSYGQLGNGNLLETTAIQTVEASEYLIYRPDIIILW